MVEDFGPIQMNGITRWEEMIDAKYFRMTEEILGEAKSKIWWTIRNPNLGNLTPKFIVLAGRSEKLCQFIQSSYDLEKPFLNIPWQNR